MSLGDDVRKYVLRKFGECERGQIILTHDDLRYLIFQFTSEWLGSHETKVGRTYERPAVYPEPDEQGL